MTIFVNVAKELIKSYLDKVVEAAIVDDNDILKQHFRNMDLSRMQRDNVNELKNHISEFGGQLSDLENIIIKIRSLILSLCEQYRDKEIIKQKESIENSSETSELLSALINAVRLINIKNLMNKKDNDDKKEDLSMFISVLSKIKNIIKNKEYDSEMNSPLSDDDNLAVLTVWIAGFNLKIEKIRKMVDFAPGQVNEKLSRLHTIVEKFHMVLEQLPFSLLDSVDGPDSFQILCEKMTDYFGEEIFYPQDGDKNFFKKAAEFVKPVTSVAMRAAKEQCLLQHALSLDEKLATIKEGHQKTRTELVVAEIVAIQNDNATLCQQAQTTVSVPLSFSFSFMSAHMPAPAGKPSRGRLEKCMEAAKLAIDPQDTIAKNSFAPKTFFSKKSNAVPAKSGLAALLKTTNKEGALEPQTRLEHSGKTTTTSQTKNKTKPSTIEPEATIEKVEEVQEEGTPEEESTLQNTNN